MMRMSAGVEFVLIAFENVLMLRFFLGGRSKSCKAKR